MKSNEYLLNNLYQSLFSTTTDCVAIYKAIRDGENFIFTDFNPSAEKIENIKKDAVIGREVTTVFPAVVDFGILDVFKRVYKTGVSEEFPLSFYADNRISGWRENVVHKLDEEHIVAIYKDITKDKQAEEELQLSAQVFENSIQGILISDKDAIVLKANQAFYDMSGYSAEEVIGKKANKLKSNIHEKEFYENMWNKINSDNYWQGEIWNRKKNGESFAVILNISTILDSKNEVKNYIAIYLDVTEQKKAQESIIRLAYNDILTDLPNRTQFELKIENNIKRAKSTKSKFALLFLDLDNFKYINDTLGHNIGDLLLIQTANRLKTVLKDLDFIARLGGDEFVIISESKDDSEDIGILCNNILEQFSEQFIIESNHLQIGCSIGVAIYPNDGLDKDTLLRNADTAMYKSKQDGKNRFYFHTKDLNQEFRRKLELDLNIKKALSNNEFEMYFQPKVCIQSDILMGAEALIRWKSPTLGMVSPIEFIPYAEETKLIIEIGDFIFHTLFNEIKNLENMGKNLKIAINISSVQLSEENFVEHVESLLNQYQCNPEMIEFEITESKIMRNVDSNIEKLKKLKALGISISIDDFGTGYSSMSYLQKLPIDVIKVDKSFVDDIVLSEDGNLIVKGIISLANALSLKTVAEGVETQEQYDFLKENKCDMIQGYLYSRPLDKESFYSFIQTK